MAAGYGEQAVCSGCTWGTLWVAISFRGVCHRLQDLFLVIDAFLLFFILAIFILRLLNSINWEGNDKSEKSIAIKYSNLNKLLIFEKLIWTILNPRSSLFNIVPKQIKIDERNKINSYYYI